MRRVLTLVFLFIVSQINSQDCLPNGITFSNQSQIDNFANNYPGCEIIEGDVIISGADIQNLMGLEPIKEMRSLVLINNCLELRNLKGLESLRSCGDLTLAMNPKLSSLNGLENLERVEGFLGIDQNPLTNLSGLRNLRSVSFLEIIINNQLKSLSGLTNLTNLKYLILESNEELGDITALSNVNPDSIIQLNIKFNNSLSHCAIESFCTHLPEANEFTEFSFNGLNFLSDSKCLSNEDVLMDCPNQRRPIAQMFLDENENGVWDTSEVYTSIGEIVLNNNEEVILGANGTANAFLTEGLISVGINLPEEWILTTDTSSFDLMIDLAGNPDRIALFGVAPTEIITRIEGSIGSQVFVCSDTIPIHLFLRNTGTKAKQTILELEYSGVYVDSQKAPDSIINNVVYWTSDIIPPGQTKSIVASFKMPSVDEIDELIDFNLKTITEVSENLFQESEFLYEELLRCAYDPNDKKVNPLGVGPESLTLFGEELNYLIRFQNTGNYPARNIHIVDTLSDNMDLETFEFLSSSHEISNIVIRNNVIDFIFNNIFLPDSVNNEPESHGFVSFKINPISGLPESTIVENNAYIYFDQNPPIVTNSTLNTLVTSIITSNEVINNNFEISIFPNPATENIYKSCKDNCEDRMSYFITNAYGTTVAEGIVQKNEAINISHMSPGMYFITFENLKSFKFLKI